MRLVDAGGNVLCDPVHTRLTLPLPLEARYREQNLLHIRQSAEGVLELFVRNYDQKFPDPAAPEAKPVAWPTPAIAAVTPGPTNSTPSEVAGMLDKTRMREVPKDKPPADPA